MLFLCSTTINMEDNTHYVINKSFSKLLIPTTISNVAVVTASLVDVALVSHYFGANGLVIAALFVPLFTLWGCIFEGFGAGASALFGKYTGNNETVVGVNVVAQINMMTFIVTILLATIGFTATYFVSPQMLGIDTELFNDAIWYGRIMFLTTIPIVMNYYLLFLVRNDSAAKTAAISSGLQVGFNIVLDILFMGYMGVGIKGAALALLIASIVALVVTASHLSSRKSTVGLRFAMPKRKTLKQVYPYSVNAITDNISDFILMMFINISILVVFGIKIASIIYIVNYIGTFLVYWSMGLTYSAAPIISVYFGEKNNKAINVMAQKGVVYSIIIGVLLAIAVSLFPNFIAVTIFNFEYSDMYALCDKAIRLFAIGVPFFFVNAMIINYMQITERFRLSFLIAISMRFIIPLMVFSLALVLDNTDIIWYSFLLANILTLIGWSLYLGVKKRGGNFDSLLCLPKVASEIKTNIFFLILPNEEKNIADYQEMIELFLAHNNICEAKIRRTTLVFEEVINYSNDTHQSKNGYIDIQVAITQDDNVRIMAKLDNDIVDINTITKVEVLSSCKMLSLHLLKSLASEFNHNRVLSFNTMNILISDTHQNKSELC